MSETRSGALSQLQENDPTLNFEREKALQEFVALFLSSFYSKAGFIIDFGLIILVEQMSRLLFPVSIDHRLSRWVMKRDKWSSRQGSDH